MYLRLSWHLFDPYWFLDAIKLYRSLSVIREGYGAWVLSSDIYDAARTGRRDRAHAQEHREKDSVSSWE